MSDTPYQDAVDLLRANDGMCFQAIRSLIGSLSYKDLKQITNFALEEERYRCENTQE